MHQTMGKELSRLAFLVAVVTLISGCETVGNAISSALESLRGDVQDEAVVSAEWNDGIPRVRPGVVVLVQVGTLGQPPTAMQAQVDQKGEITLQYLLQEPVFCDGLTLDALKQKLVKAYQVYIKQPQISVTFAQFDKDTGVSPWGTVTVLGEVARPGPVNMPPTMDLTVTKVLQAAGGLKPFANKSKIQVTSCDRDGNKKKTIIDLNEIGEKGLADKDISLRAGDVVWVPESWY